MRGIAGRGESPAPRRSLRRRTALAAQGTGIGLSAAQTHLFGEFEQTDASTTRGCGGTGRTRAKPFQMNMLFATLLRWLPDHPPTL